MWNQAEMWNHVEMWNLLPDMDMEIYMLLPQPTSLQGLGILVLFYVNISFQFLVVVLLL